MKGNNACCPYLVIIDCADSNEHSHIACQGSLNDSPGIGNHLQMRSLITGIL